MAIRAVIFDFGGVLCFHPADRQIVAAANACGVPLDEFTRAFWKNRTVYDQGVVSAHEYWRDIARQTGREFDDALIAEMIGREINFWSNFDTRVTDWVVELRDQGIRTAMLSNLPEPLALHLKKTAVFLKHFDHLTLSYELKVVKPQRAIYEDAIRGLGIAPNEGLFLDDRPENVEGGAAVGLQSVLYTSWDAFKPENYGLSAPARRQ